MSDTCGYIRDDGQPCQNPAGDGGYCHIDSHAPDTEKVAEPEGKSLESLEGKAIDVLEREMETGRGPNARVKAARVALEHVREAGGE